MNDPIDRTRRWGLAARHYLPVLLLPWIWLHHPALGANPLPPLEAPPKNFKVEWRGWQDREKGRERINLRILNWDGQTLTETIGRPSPPGTGEVQRVARPAAATWKEAWARFHQADVWQWRERYGGESFGPDSAAWEIVVEWGTNRVHSSGQGLYPSMVDVRRPDRRNVMLNRLATALDVLMAQTVEVEGRYFAGFEASIFQPSTEPYRNQRWWLTGNREFHDRYRKFVPESDGSGLRRFAHPEVIARLRGRLVGPGSYGHLGGYRYEFAVDEVLEMKAAPARP